MRTTHEAEIEILTLTSRVRELELALENVVLAMRLWGNEEDGVPEDGPIGAAYDLACQLLLAAKQKSTEQISF